MRNCLDCNRDLSALVSRHKKCWSCRQGKKPVRVNVKYTKELLEEAAANSVSVAGVMRYVGTSGLGGNHSHITRRLKEYQIDVSHFTGQAHNKGVTSSKRKTWQQILCLGNSTDYRSKTPQLKRALLEYGLTYECSECKISEWQGKKLTLHIDHISGIIYDNRPENVRFLCPNCHSQTDTYCRPKGD